MSTGRMLEEEIDAHEITRSRLAAAQAKIDNLEEDRAERVKRHADERKALLEAAEEAHKILAKAAQAESGALRRDAERYQVARNIKDWSHNMKNATSPEEFDAACDAKEKA
jgi:hypothetical protein